MEEENKMPETVDEPTIRFKVISDRGAFNIINEEINKTLVEISGYDLQVNFNMEYINSIADVEAAVAGIGDLFRQIIMDKLLEYKQNKQ